MYELADVLLWAMPPDVEAEHLSVSASGAASDAQPLAPTGGRTLPPALPGIQDFNRFKGVVTDIVSAPAQSLRAGYEGQVVLGIDGKRLVAENIQDDYAWRVSIPGPRTGATAIEFESQRAIQLDPDSVGPSYLRRKGFDVVTLGCSSSGDTPDNAEGLYLVRAPGKAPTLLTWAVSTGSAGVFVRYRLHFGALDPGDVPGTQPNFEGRVQGFGVCPYPAFR